MYRLMYRLLHRLLLAGAGSPTLQLRLSSTLQLRLSLTLQLRLSPLRFAWRRGPPDVELACQQLQRRHLEQGPQVCARIV